MTQLHVKKKRLFHSNNLIILFVALTIFALLTACSTTSSTNTNTTISMPAEGNMGNMNGMDMGEGADGGGEEEEPFIPNDGAVVHISTPANEANFKLGDPVLMTIETTNFTIGENGNHWHIFLDGTPIMVMGGNTYVLQDLSVGQHNIMVYLSNGQHENLEQGDQITILVEE